MSFVPALGQTEKVSFTDMRDEEQQTCGICWEPVGDGIGHCVQHIFHKSCAIPSLYLDPSCPTCRKAVDIQFPIYVPQMMLRDSSQSGNLEIVKRLITQNVVATSDEDTISFALSNAACNGHFAIVSELLHNCSPSIRLSSIGFALKDLLQEKVNFRKDPYKSILQKLLNQLHSDSEQHFSSIPSNPTQQMQLDAQLAQDLQERLRTASSEGNLDTVRWLRLQGAVAASDQDTIAFALSGAACNGHLEIVVELLRGCSSSARLFSVCFALDDLLQNGIEDFCVDSNKSILEELLAQL